MDALIKVAWRVEGLAAGRGVGIVRPEYVAFVPTERPKHLVASVAWGAAGFVEVGAGRIAPETIFRALQAGAIDDVTNRLVSSLAGVRWPRTDCRLLEKKLFLRPKRRGLWFVRGKESIRIAAVSLDEIAASLGAWPRM